MASSVGREDLAKGGDESLILMEGADGDPQGCPEPISGQRTDGHPFLRQGSNNLVYIPFDIDKDEVCRRRYVAYSQLLKSLVEILLAVLIEALRAGEVRFIVEGSRGGRGG